MNTILTKTTTVFAKQVFHPRLYTFQKRGVAQVVDCDLATFRRGIIINAMKQKLEKSIKSSAKYVNTSEKMLPASRLLLLNK
jgi:HKD family nuclease